ncbi:integrase [candidate division KSB1 bacterium]|nr:integrase [candidate division KSB1 bacterium]
MVRTAKYTALCKRISAHAFCHGFAAHLLKSGYKILVLQRLFGPGQLDTTLICSPVLRQGALGVKSPRGLLLSS